MNKIHNHSASRWLSHGMMLLMLTRGTVGEPLPTYTISEIPMPPGAVAISAQGINSHGDVTGYFTLNTGITLGFVWSDGVFTALLPMPGQANALAFDISDTGLVAGYSGFSTAPDKAVVWSNGQPQSLGTFGGAWSAASGVSSSGLVAGWAQVEQTSNRFHGLVFDGKAVHDVGLLLGGVVTQLADVNADGVAVGIGQTVEGHFHAIMVDPLDGMLDLGTLGGATSEAEAISDAGYITGRAQIGIPNAATFDGIVRHAFLWHHGKMIDLGALPASGLIESRGLDVNSGGQVVGEVNNENLTSIKAFVWSRGVMSNLNGLIPPGGGWVLRSATAINVSGWIAGNGTHNGQSRAFVLQPVDLQANRESEGPMWESSICAPNPSRLESIALTMPNHFYVIRAVGPLPGQPGPIWAWDINDAGNVYGAAHVNESRESRCFVMEHDGQLTVFAADQGHPFIWPGAINNAPSFVGGLQFLPALFPQFPSTEASHGRDINNTVPPWGVGSERLSQKIGTGAFNTIRSYLVLLDGNPNSTIPIPALGGTFSRAEALNDSRDAVGASLSASGPLRAFLRLGTTGAISDLGTLGGSHSWATDVNNAQQVVGWSRRADGSTGAFLLQNSTMIDLGTLGGDLSEAYGVNDSGTIVGTSFNALGKPRAFVVDNGIMIDLNSRIAANSSWVLQTAREVNESGSIVGWGRLNNETRGFVLIPRGAGDATLDGRVGVDDLLAVIMAWGSCAPPCPCDFNGDGVVNTDDLLAVITNWG